MIIGIDLDNTIINFDPLIKKLADAKGYLGDKKIKGINHGPIVHWTKREIRDYLRKLPSGEQKWQEIQKQVYESGLSKAQVNGGVLLFIKKFLSLGTIYIVSHKSPELRKQAVKFLQEKGIVRGNLITQDHFFTEESRSDKIERIRKLKIDYFIDDLPEVLSEPAFPRKATRILYNRDGTNINIRGIKVFSSFSAIDDYIGEKETEKLSKKIKRAVISMHRIKGGGNSRIFLLNTSSGKLILKTYYRLSGQTNKRFDRELSALKLLNKYNFRNVPRLIFADRDNKFIVYEFINGRKIASGKISGRDIDKLLDFLKKLESLRKKQQLKAIDDAAEACFSLSELFHNINSRYQRLIKISGRDKRLGNLYRFLINDFSPLFARIKKTVIKTTLPENRRKILSPSDFGFHNSLKDSRGRLFFLDFEHFGWDDPVKLISDFLLHPKMRLNKKQKEYFLVKILKVYNDENTALRLPLFFPLYGLKWCLILLNEFSDIDFLRRKFAGTQEGDKEKILLRQFTKAGKMFEFVRKNYQKFPYEIDRT